MSIIGGNLCYHRAQRMKKFITYLPLTILFIIGITFSFAQQSQNTQKPNPEIEVLKKRISELESKLQTVENVEKMGLAAKLADANAKLVNAEFSKFERELRDANDKWLRDWGVFFLAILAVVGLAFWYVLKSLIANSIEKRLDGFKKAVEQLNVIKNQLRVLQKEHVVSMLENSHRFSGDETYYREQIKTLPEKALLDVFEDEARLLLLRHKAAEALANRKSPQLVSPALSFLNSVVNSDFDWEQDFTTQYHMRDLVNFLGYIGTPEVYEGLKKFLDRLLTEHPENKGLVLTPTAFSLVYVSSELNKRDFMSILKKAIPFFRVSSEDVHGLKNLAEYFDRFKDPDGIKDILTNGLTDMMPDAENQCLELLQKHDPDFVEKWRAEKENANTQNEESE